MARNPASEHPRRCGPSATTAARNAGRSLQSCQGLGGCPWVQRRDRKLWCKLCQLLSHRRRHRGPGWLQQAGFVHPGAGPSCPSTSGTRSSALGFGVACSTRHPESQPGWKLLALSTGDFSFSFPVQDHPASTCLQHFRLLCFYSVLSSPRTFCVSDFWIVYFSLSSVPNLFCLVPFSWAIFTSFFSGPSALA